MTSWTIPTCERRKYTRAEAIELLTLLQESQYDDEIDPYDFDSMDNAELEEELCLSGVVHDDDMLGVI